VVWHKTAIAAALAALVSAAAVQAQTFPDKSIQIVVPYAAGSSNDSTARLLGNEMSQSLKVPVVIANIAGGSGILGTQDVINSRPDGYNLLWSGPSVLLTTLLYAKPPYEMAKLAPVVFATTSPYVFTVYDGVPASTLQEFVAYARTKPGALNYGTGGSSSTTNLYMIRFMRMTGTDMIEIAYRGGPETMVALMRGDIHVLPAQPELALTGGAKVRVLASSSEARNVLLPDVPTFREQGFDFVVSVWNGIFAPAATPPAVVARLNAEVNRAMNQAAVRERLNRLGFVLHGGTSEEFAAFLQDEAKAWGQTIETAQIPKL
jgi:tripartite-type tricarboxylate transporter receptor subunit TctC